jgi:hypothetical protein
MGEGQAMDNNEKLARIKEITDMPGYKICEEILEPRACGQTMCSSCIPEHRRRIEKERNRRLLEILEG